VVLMIQIIIICKIIKLIVVIIIYFVEMSFPRSIIYIGKEDNNIYVYTLEGSKYLLDDVTEDGLVYMNDEDGWVQVFRSIKDLKIIKLRHNLEELEELKTMMMHIFVS